MQERKLHVSTCKPTLHYVQTIPHINFIGRFDHTSFQVGPVDSTEEGVPLDVFKPSTRTTQSCGVGLV